MWKKVIIIAIACAWLMFILIFKPHKEWDLFKSDQITDQITDQTTDQTTDQIQDQTSDQTSDQIPGDAEVGKTQKIKPVPRKMRTAPAETEFKKTFTNKYGLTFVHIPQGTFMMGSPYDEPGRYDRELPHQVTLTSGFYMQTTEVTQKHWSDIMIYNLAYFKYCGEDCPIEHISWNDARMFIRRLNQLDPDYFYRLPTEAEWEYACRGGTQTPFFWGSDEDCRKANFGSGFTIKQCLEINPGKPVKVASFPPNAWGLYDMHGNVWEWCEDRFDDYPTEPVTDPWGGYSNLDRVFRGGAWSVASRYCRSANRDAAPPGTRLSDVGFRLVALPYVRMR